MGLRNKNEFSNEGESHGGSLSVRSFDLARSGLEPPPEISCSLMTQSSVSDVICEKARKA